MINATAFADRGWIVHSNGTGWLNVNNLALANLHEPDKESPNLTVPGVWSATGTIILPSFTVFLISKAANVMAQLMKTEESARSFPLCHFVRAFNTNGDIKYVELPGQILRRDGKPCDQVREWWVRVGDSKGEVGRMN